MDLIKGEDHNLHYDPPPNGVYMKKVKTVSRGLYYFINNIFPDTL
jgi:hypothetical protein